MVHGGSGLQSVNHLKRETVPTQEEPTVAAIKQWNLDVVKAEVAYGMLPTLGSTSVVDWRDIQVGHIDTGVRRHRVFGPWADGRSETLLLEDGVNYKEPGELPLDPMNYTRQGDEWMINEGHGTRTASVICGYEAGKFRGVAPGLPVIPYRAVNGVDLTTSRTKRVAQALSHAVRDRLCEVVSISLGSGAPATALQRAVATSYESGTIIVAAAGQPIKNVVYPARYAGAVGVGGITDGGEIYNPYSPGKADSWTFGHPLTRCESGRAYGMEKARADSLTSILRRMVRPMPRRMWQVLPRCGLPITTRTWREYTTSRGRGSRRFVR